MRYSREHKRKTRRRIVESARRLFGARGFSATSIEAIMSECRLTRGGFYAHFRSKSELYREALEHDEPAGRRGPGRDGDDGCIDAMLGEYLEGDRLAFLATDAASEEPEVRAAYTRAFKSMSLRFRSRMGGACDESSVLSATAMLIGTLAVAQTTDDPELRAGLLASCRTSAKTLLGPGGASAELTIFWAPTAE